MINLTIEALRDFQACSLYYNFEHVEKPVIRISNQRRTATQFKEALISVVNFFFYKKLSWQEPSYRVLESKWEKRWLRDTTAADAVTKSSSANNAYSTDAYYTTRATAALLQLHKSFANKPNMEVVMIDEPFTVALNKTIALDGSFDLVMRSKKPDGGYQYHIYAWSVNMGNKSLDYWSTLFTSLDYAFRYRNNFDPNIDVLYYLWDFTDTKPGVRKFLIEIKDHALLKLWADNFARHQDPYPIRGLSAYCKSCKYDKPCLRWEPKKEEPIVLKKAVARK